MMYRKDYKNNVMSGIALSMLVAMLVPATAFAASSTNKGANPNGKPFVELNGAIVEVEGEISSLQDQIDALVGRVDTIEDAQAAMQIVIADLQAENADLQAQIDANSADVASLEGQISALNADILNLEQQIADLGDADGALQAQIDENDASITTLALAIDTLEGNLQATIDNNTALITLMQMEIDAIQDSLDFYQLLVSGSCPEGQAIREIGADGSVICEVVNAGGPANVTELRAFANKLTNNGYAKAVATCPEGSVMTGGGFFGNVGGSESFGGWPGFFYGDPTQITARQYIVEVRGAEYSGGIFSVAMCLEFN